MRSGRVFEWSFPYYVIGAALVALLPFRGAWRSRSLDHSVALLTWCIFLRLSIGRKRGGDGGCVLAGHCAARSRNLYARNAGGWGLLLPALVAFDTLEPAGSPPSSPWACLLHVENQAAGMPATISLGFVVTLFSIVRCALPGHRNQRGHLLVQVLWKAGAAPRRCKPIQHGQPRNQHGTCSLGGAKLHASVRGQFDHATLSISTALLFCVNTVLISAAICLSSAKPLKESGKLLFLVVPFTSPERARRA